MIENIAKAVQGRAEVRITDPHRHTGRLGVLLDHFPEFNAVKVGFQDSKVRVAGDYTLVKADSVELVQVAPKAKPVKVSPKMLEELEYAAYRDEVAVLANPDAASTGLAMWISSSRTRNALVKRGLITFTYGTQRSPKPQAKSCAALTVAGWALVRPEGRPADPSRMTLAEALEDAYASI